jgi:hypothetical protein
MRRDGPISIGEILRHLEIGWQGSGDLVRQVNWREALRAELGEDLWPHTVVLEVSAQRVVLGALGPALVALRAKRTAIEQSLRDLGFVGEVVLVASARRLGERS